MLNHESQVIYFGSTSNAVDLEKLLKGYSILWPKFTNTRENCFIKKKICFKLLIATLCN